MGLDVAFPAHAGLNRINQPLLFLIQSVPRTRGAKPLGLTHPVNENSRSPHTRGYKGEVTRRYVPYVIYDKHLPVFLGWKYSDMERKKIGL